MKPINTINPILFLGILLFFAKVTNQLCAIQCQTCGNNPIKCTQCSSATRQPVTASNKDCDCIDGYT